MSKTCKITAWVLAAAFLVAACQPDETPPTSGEEEMLNNSVAGTMTAAAADVLQTQTALAANTPVARSSATPESTMTSTLEPTSEPTQSGVWLSVQENTNCRTGQGSSFGWVALIEAGEKVEAAARNPYGDYYFIHNPNSPGSLCWLWSRYSTVTGNAAVLPVYTPQPTSTPRVTPTLTLAPYDVSFEFIGVENCGLDYYFRFFIKNTGASIWQSFSLMVVDQTDGTTFAHESNSFTDAQLCVLGLDQADLTSGEYSYIVGYNPGQLTYDPVGIGHTFEVTLTVYTNNNRIGKSVTKTLILSP